MAKCPTGFTKNESRKACDIVGAIGEVISSITFPTAVTQWPFLALPFGRFEAPVIPLNVPTLLPNRGLYFDGDGDFLRLYDIRFNFQFTIHAWVHVFKETGHLFSLETSIPNNKNIFDQELAVKFAVDGDMQLIHGVWDDEVSTPALATGFLNAWKIFAIRFENFSDAGATKMSLWGNTDLLIDYVWEGSNWFHDTLLDRPHVFGSSILENILVNNNLEMHLY